jgi:transcriptional regulator with XRE-family HTH domain
MNPDWFAGRLRELREAKGLSREQLAESAGMKVGGIRDLEQGVRSPTWKTVLALCQALSVSCEEFTREPADRPPAAPGRPRKAAPAEPPPKRPRGRPPRAK